MARLLSAIVAGVTVFHVFGSVVADSDIYFNVEAFELYADQQGGYPNQTFRSSDIVAPVFSVNLWDFDNTDNAPYIFLGTVYGHMKAGPMVFDARDLSLIYADQRYENVYSSSVQVANGTHYLTFWEGGHSRGHASGYCLIYDENYHLVYNVTAPGLDHRGHADMHELVLTNHTIIYSTYLNIKHDCSSVGGPEDCLLMDSGFQEVDLETNEILFTWNASNHFEISDTFVEYNAEVDSGFDFFHINSIEKADDGNYLISSRHLSLIVLIDGKDGHPIWVLGGKKNQFQDLSNGNATSFGWQHHARFYNNNSHITMFDNHGETTEHCQTCSSRGLQLEIDTLNMTARLIQDYLHPAGINSGAMGSFQKLESGNVMIGWGYNAGFVEYKNDGTPVMDVQRGKLGSYLADMFAYRVNKHYWNGRPNWPPAMAADAPFRTTLNSTVYLSWNGATDVAAWAVLAADNATEINSSKRIIASSPRKGFETTIYLGSAFNHRYIAAAALASNGNVIGSTYVLDLEDCQPVFLASGITSVHPSRKRNFATAFVTTSIILTLGISACIVAYFWKSDSRCQAGKFVYTRMEGYS